MRQFLSFFLSLIILAGCVSTSKYEVAQRNLQNEVHARQLATQKLDSLSYAHNALKSDFNTLEYELSESEKYASFTDYDLIKALQYYRAESERLSLDLKSAQKNSYYHGWLSEKRAESFTENAQCNIKENGTKKYVLQKDNIVYIDTEGLMILTKGDPQAFRTLFIQLLEPIQNNKDWKMNLCLNISDPSTDWKRLTLQNEMMTFFATEVKLPSENLASITRIIPQQKSPEFGYFTHSRLLIEIEFMGS